MLGLMQDWPLLCHRMLDHAATYHAGRADRLALGRRADPSHQLAAVRARALKVAQRLERDGIRLGDRVATLAWNTWRHLEAWYGIMGIGAIYHTVNPRLFPEQIVWIVNHAEDRVMLVDLTFVPLLEKLADQLPSIERYMVLTDAAHMPATTLKNAVAYEEWIGEADGDFAWKSFDENTAAGMCYTSGTTGHPKGVLYSHRSNVLHSMMATWRPTPWASPPRRRHAGGADVPRQLLGARPHRADDRRHAGDAGREDRRRVDLRIARTTITSPSPAAVPTVWLMLLQHLEANGAKLPHLRNAWSSAARPARAP